VDPESSDDASDYDNSGSDFDESGSLDDDVSDAGLFFCLYPERPDIYLTSKATIGTSSRGKRQNVSMALSCWQ